MRILINTRAREYGEGLDFDKNKGVLCCPLFRPSLCLSEEEILRVFSELEPGDLVAFYISDGGLVSRRSSD